MNQKQKSFTPLEITISNGARRSTDLAGFTLVETIVVVAIIALISSVILVSLNSARSRARDVKRKAEISQIGRFLSTSCYVPDGGEGEYDLAELIEELKIKYPQYVALVPRTPKDPKTGTETESFYKYIVTANSEDCALYANLENENEPITIPGLSAPAAGGGIGVFEAQSAGWNGTRKYFQYSN